MLDPDGVADRLLCHQLLDPLVLLVGVEVDQTGVFLHDVVQLGLHEQVVFQVALCPVDVAIGEDLLEPRLVRQSPGFRSVHGV